MAKKTPKTTKTTVDAEASTSRWRNRIVGSGFEDAASLLANPRNWRIHPQEQQDALAGVLDKVGWVQNIVVNQRTGFVVDGHLRVAMSSTAGEKVPVLYVDLSEDEEALVLATIDPVAGMAERDADKMAALLAELGDSDLGDLGEGLDAMLHAMNVECEEEIAANQEKAPVEAFKPATLKSACIADLAPTEEERAILAGRKLLIEYSGGKDSSAAAVWARHYFPNNPTELLFVDLGADFVGFHLYLFDAAKFLGVPLIILRSEKTVLDTMLNKGEWPHHLHPYCHENLHQPLDDYMLKHEPESIAILRGGRLSERSATGKKNESRFLVVDRMKKYAYFQPLYFSDKDSSLKLLEEAGLPVWHGYECGLQRTACRICPGQRPYSYSAIRFNFPDVWRELLDLERRFGPGAWQMCNPDGGHFGFEAAADKGQEKFEAGNYARP